jgi:hypothetical protein
VICDCLGPETVLAIMVLVLAVGGVLLAWLWRP